MGGEQEPPIWCAFSKREEMRMVLGTWQGPILISDTAGLDMTELFLGADDTHGDLGI